MISANSYQVVVRKRELVGGARHHHDEAPVLAHPPDRLKLTLNWSYHSFGPIFREPVASRVDRRSAAVSADGHGRLQFPPHPLTASIRPPNPSSDMALARL